jgi:hypothetical protein
LFSGRGAFGSRPDFAALRRERLSPEPDAKQIRVHYGLQVGVGGRIRTGGDTASLNDLGSWNRKPIRGALLNSVQIQELVALNSAGNGYTGPLWSRYTT